jgi:hypothetical protein
VSIGVRAVIGNDANQPVADILILAITVFQPDMKMRAPCPISGSNDSREMRLISKLGTVHRYGINESFSYV